MLDLPSGTYRVTVVSVELAGTRTDVQIVFEIAAGPHRGARFSYITRTALERPPGTDIYPAFARFVAAATGVECGDAAQQTVDENVLAGRELDVTVRCGLSGLPHVVRFAPAQRVARRARRPRCDVAGAPERRDVARKHVDALATSARYDGDQLTDIVESVSRGRTRALAHLSARERETLIARMRGFV
jgi:hypothetical protein